MDPRLIAALSIIVGTVLIGGLGAFGISQIDTDFQFSSVAPSFDFGSTNCEWRDHPRGGQFSDLDSFFDAYEANTNGTRDQLKQVFDFRVEDGGVEYRTCEVNS